MNQTTDKIRTICTSQVEILAESAPVNIVRTESDKKLKFQSYAHMLYPSIPQDSASLSDRYSISP